MFKNVLRTSLFVGLASVTTLTPAFADGVEDYYHQQNQQRFFNYPQSARTLGAAGSSAVTSSGSFATVANPAGLGWMRDAEVSGTYGYEQLTGNSSSDYSDIESETNSGDVLAAFPIMPYSNATPAGGNIGFGWSGYNGDVNSSTDNTDGYRLHLAYAKAISDETSLGYSISYHNDEIKDSIWDSEEDDGVKQTVGAQFKTGDTTTVGVSTFYGFGTAEGNDGNEDADRSSWGAELGLAEQLAETTLLTTSVDYANYNTDNGNPDTYGWGFKVGIEEALTDWLKARAGYRYQANMDGIFDHDANAKYNAVAFGLGVKLAESLFVDYGAEYRHVGDGDWSHLISATVPFSICD